MTGPRGEACGRCYFFQPSKDGEPRAIGCCRHANLQSVQNGFFVAYFDEWCSEFRPHPDHACELCFGDAIRNSICEGKVRQWTCPQCHGTGLRREEETDDQ